MDKNLFSSLLLNRTQPKLGQSCANSLSLAMDPPNYRVRAASVKQFPLSEDLLILIHVTLKKQQFFTVHTAYPCLLPTLLKSAAMARARLHRHLQHWDQMPTSTSMVAQESVLVCCK